MSISDNTKKTYKIMFDRFKDRTDSDPKNISADKIISLVRDIYPDSDRSNIIMLSALQNAIKSDDKYNKKNILKMEKISKEITSLNDRVSSKDKKGRYNSEEMEKFVKWDDIDAAADKFISDKSEKTINRLIVGLYTILPPRRADYWNLVFKTSGDEKPQKNINLLVKTSKGLVLNIGDYKTKKTFGTIVIKLYKTYKQLEDLFNEFIKEEGLKDGDRVFESARINSANSFTKKVNSLFKKLTGKELGINMLRHSYINNFLSESRSLEERERLGLLMGHSAMTQMLYDKRPAGKDKKESDDIITEE